jgi:RNA polymerase sigma-70 factor, ECF subfamily
VQGSEQQQLQAIRQGDENAFEMIFRTYYNDLCHYAFSFLRNKDEAEETVQTTFLQLWEKHQTLSIVTSLRAYLYAAVRNASLNRLKHERVKQQHRHYVEHSPMTTTPDATQQLEAEELQYKMLLAIQSLPEQCRLIFQMSRFEELKYAEIAEKLHLSVKTVENQMGKALRIMREQLKDYLPVLLLLFSGWFDLCA